MVASAAGMQALAVLGQRLCLTGAVLGAIGLVGWASGVGWLTTILPGQPPMMPNTALGLLLVGVAGALRESRGRGLRRAIADLAAGSVVIVGLATGVEYALGVDLHIDELLMRTGSGPYPGRMSPPTAVALVCLGAAILVFDSRPQALIRPSEWLTVAAGLVALAAGLGILFGTGPLYPIEEAPVIGVAVHTALSLLLIATGLLLERPGAGIMRVVTSPGPGGGLLRRLAVAAVVLPAAASLVLSWLLGRLGLEQLPFVYATLAVAATVVGLFLITVIGVPLERTHEALVSSHARARALFEQASDAVFVADRAGRYTEVNRAACDLLGYTREELLGKTILDLIPAGDEERFATHRGRIFAGESELGEWTLACKDGTRVPVEVSAKLLPDGRWQAFVRDIRERKRAQEQIRQALERVELALRGADLAAWDWNVATGEVTFNARWAEMRGFQPHEVEPRVESWRRGIHPDDRTRVEQALADHFEGRAPEYGAEMRVATRDGSWIWVLDRGRVFARDAQGRPTRMVGTELEVTQRKHAEEALRLSEARFAGIVALSADAILSIDAEQRITLFNASAEKIFGYARHEVIGAPLDVLIPQRFRAAHRRHVQEFAEAPEATRRLGDAWPLVYGLRRSGEEFPAQAAISKLEVGGARVLTASLRDVSEQRRRESENETLAELGAALASTLELREALHHVARLAVRSFADVCVVSVLDVPEERGPLNAVGIREAGLAWAGELLERAPFEPGMVGMAMARQHAVLERQLSEERLKELAHGPDQLRALRALAPRSLLAVRLVAHGEALGTLTLLSSNPWCPYAERDVGFAEELALRASLWIANARLYRALQRAVRARDDVLGVVAHDLRNPLGVILLRAHALHREIPAESVARQQVAGIERAADRMKRLLQDLLDVTRIEAGQLALQRAPTSPYPIAMDALESQRALAGAASLELRLDLAEDLPDVWVDRDRLLQVLENLIGNALKFTPPGGRITLGAARHGSDVRFWVADTGAGLAAEDLPHLFDRFWQARHTRSEGAGLGLAIVKGIVEAHGGAVWVESTPGQGSTFSILMPTMGTARSA